MAVNHYHQQIQFLPYIYCMYIYIQALVLLVILTRQVDSIVPSEVLYLLKSVRPFGHFEKPLFMELCKHVETTFVPSGAILFRPGQLDDSIYVVSNGRLKVYIMEPVRLDDDQLTCIVNVVIEPYRKLGGCGLGGAWGFE